jgi:type IV pilus assembly PilN-like protein
MRAVNLLPKETLASRSFTAQHLPAVVGGTTGFVVVAALAASFLSASSKVADAQSGYNAAKDQLASTPLPPPPPQPVNPTPTALVNAKAPRLQAVASALGQRIAWDRILREFSQALPADVWISSLNMNAPVAGATNGFSITATTYSYDSVARMLARMALVPDLTGVTLQSTTRSGRLVQFSLSASIKGAAAPPVPAAPVAAPTDTSTDSTSTDSSGAGQ